MKPLVSLFLSAGLVIGCSPASHAFHTTLSSQGQYPLPLVLNDGTSLVTAIDSTTPDLTPPTSPTDASLQVRAAPGLPNAFIAHWLGGACARDAVLTFTRSGARYELHLAVYSRSGACIAVGVFRAVRISTSVPIAVDSITASGSEL